MIFCTDGNYPLHRTRVFIVCSSYACLTLNPLSTYLSDADPINKEEILAVTGFESCLTNDTIYSSIESDIFQREDLKWTSKFTIVLFGDIGYCGNYRYSKRWLGLRSVYMFYRCVHNSFLHRNYCSLANYSRWIIRAILEETSKIFFSQFYKYSQSAFRWGCNNIENDENETADYRCSN